MSPNRASASRASTRAGTNPSAVIGSKPSSHQSIDDLESTGPPVEARLDPPDEAIAEQEWQDVVAPASFRGRDVDLPDVVEAVQRTEEVTVPHEWIERGEERDARRPCVSGVGAPRPAVASRRSISSARTKRSPADPLDGDRDERSGFDQLSEQLAAGRGIRTVILGGSTWRCRSTARHSPCARGDRAPDSVTAACGDAAPAPDAGPRGARRGRGARPGRRRGGSPRAGRDPGSRPRPGPRGSPGPGWSGASTSRSPRAAQRRSTTTDRRVRIRSSSSSTSGACSSNAAPVCSTRLRSQATRYQGSSRVGTIDRPLL